MNYKKPKFRKIKMDKNFSKLVFLVILTMTAFATNSILARLAISNQEIGPASFSLIRLLSGSIILIIIIVYRLGIIAILNIKPNLYGILGLSLYMIGFHYAYNSLEAGIGSIILFGGVQIVIFSSAIISKENPSLFNWFGMILAMIGIFILFFPEDLTSTQPIIGLLLMLLAAIGWGIYTISGKSSKNPLKSTMSNFIFTIPIIIINILIYPDIIKISFSGFLLAFCSGTVMSALGYSLWFSILPFLEKTISALVQMLVPVIALTISILFLEEKLSYLSFFSSLLIIIGVLIGIFAESLVKKYEDNKNLS